MDNLSSHRAKAEVDRFGEKIGGWLWDRFTVHYMPRQTPLAQRPAARSQSLEPEDESRPGHHRLAVYKQKGASDLRLQNNYITQSQTQNGHLPHSIAYTEQIRWKREKMT